MDPRPSQVVIVAGGRGTRLGPRTADRPKPMIEIGGRPFLEWLLESVRDRGLDRILLLLGYRADVIQEHFGDGGRWGLRIDYVVTDPSDDTARRVRAAAEKLDDRFLFLYCDNIWPMAFDRMWERFKAADVPAMVTVYRNEDGYSRDNVRLDEHDNVVLYDPSRRAPGLRGVEIGYALFDRSILALLSNWNDSLADAIYPELIRRRQLVAFPTSHRYYSIGDPERLPATERFLAGPPAIIVDRDGVLNQRPPRAEYVRTWSDFRWLPGALDALRLLAEANYRVIVVSNQAGIGRGAITEGDLSGIHRRMREEARAAGGRIDAVYYCPHGWDAGCECRKPKPGLLFQAQRDLELDLTRTPFVGDDERDAMAAQAAGCPALMVTERVSLLDLVRDLGVTAAPRRIA